MDFSPCILKENWDVVNFCMADLLKEPMQPTVKQFGKTNMQLCNTVSNKERNVYNRLTTL